MTTASRSLYDRDVTAEYDVPFFRSEVEAVKGPVLELMAGTGRLSLPLIEAGATSTCVDSSAGMLEVLSRKLARRGLRRMSAAWTRAGWSCTRTSSSRSSRSSRSWKSWAATIGPALRSTRPAASVMIETCKKTGA